MFSKLYLLLKKIRTGLFFQRTKAIYREKALSLLHNRNMYIFYSQVWSYWKDSKRFKRQVTSFEEMDYAVMDYLRVSMVYRKSINRKFYRDLLCPLWILLQMEFQVFWWKFCPLRWGIPKTLSKISVILQNLWEVKLLKQTKCWYHLMSFPCLQISQLILPSRLRQKD